ncbi:MULTISPECIES: hypothetical protein [unclassified Mesorhizobium]|uniref:hypothetical protein n=1 Tax=unclassified Mesorhizobium TaxID=325217 RepID=UPI00241631DD|nr:MULTISPECIES: hypothetical protein [unclassified Mesorhizobium]WFP62888.1 hypothetical protein QAZ47_31430 [Mesorhizobium sp. WSM4904]WFP76160.1 hypothetical protein QAZ22_31555 [Mesorhizobium sp. WSM4906]
MSAFRGIGLVGPVEGFFPLWPQNRLKTFQLHPAAGRQILVFAGLAVTRELGPLLAAI